MSCRLEKLVNDPTEGNAWHADHIVPVYRGGGMMQHFIDIFIYQQIFGFTLECINDGNDIIFTH